MAPFSDNVFPTAANAAADLGVMVAGWANTATRVELEPIDGLEEKLKQLVGMVEHMKTEQSRAAQENERLGREVDALSQLADSDTAVTELSSLREERDLIRSRVGEMLEQLEALNL